MNLINIITTIIFRSKFNLPIINILWRVVSSEQFEYDDPKLMDLLQKVCVMVVVLLPSFHAT